jgi:hypothetical protein
MMPASAWKACVAVEPANVTQQDGRFTHVAGQIGIAEIEWVGLHDLGIIEGDASRRRPESLGLDHQELAEPPHVLATELLWRTTPTMRQIVSTRSTPMRAR